MWVYNGLYSGGLTGIYDLHAEVRDTGTGDIPSTLDRPRPIKASIRYRKAGVITLRFPKEYFEKVYDLRTYDANRLNINVTCNTAGSY